MRLAIGTDHRGVEIKKYLIEKLEPEYEMIDCSPDNYDSDDYPDFAYRVCQEAKKDDETFGILICGTGIGMSIAANKVKGIRCALIHTVEEAMLAREHNDANVLAFGEKTNTDNMVQMIKVFLNATPSTEEKHRRRVKKIMDIESGEYNEL